MDLANFANAKSMEKVDLVTKQGANCCGISIEFQTPLKI